MRKDEKLKLLTEASANYRLDCKDSGQEASGDEITAFNGGFLLGFDRATARAVGVLGVMISNWETLAKPSAASSTTAHVIYDLCADDARAAIKELSDG